LSADLMKDLNITHTHWLTYLLFSLHIVWLVMWQPCKMF